MKRFFVLLLFLLIAVNSHAEEKVRIEEVVVTATRLPEPPKETTAAVVVITKEEIKNMNVQFIADVLRQVSELNLVQSGGKGKLADVHLRGGKASHTLVMIDGIRAKSTTTGSYDFSGLTVDDIERIEIVKGPQSTIYGSEAMAGVVNIITKKGEGRPKAELSVEEGSFRTYKPALSVSGGSKRLDYRFTASHFRTDGISDAKSGVERDGYENVSFSGKLGIKVNDKAEFEFTGRHYYDLSELDAFGADDPNYIQRGYHSMLSGKEKFYLMDKWEQVLTLSTVRDSLEYRDPDWGGFDISSGMDTIEWQNNLYISDTYTITAGAEHREEIGENKDMTGLTIYFDSSINNKAVYLNNKLKTLKDSLILNAGLRYDSHEIAGDETTYRVGALYEIKPIALRLRSSYGTGFRAPTLNDLFYQDPWGSSGNPNLKPEKSTSWELGAEKDILKKASVSIIYFVQDYEDLIEWVETPPGSWQYHPRNTDATVKGIETGLSLKPIDILDIKAGYTYLDTEDKSTGERLIRRPDHKFNTTATLSNKKYSLAMNYIYVGERDDIGGKLSPYDVVNVSGSLNITKALSLFGKVENVFDEDYEEARGYGTLGRTFYGGMKANF